MNPDPLRIRVQRSLEESRKAQVKMDAFPGPSRRRGGGRRRGPARPGSLRLLSLCNGSGAGIVLRKEDALIPQELKYTKDHEWVKEEDGKVRVGITHHAQKELGDIVFVELPQVGKVAKKGELLGTVESVKAVGEVYAPASGEVVETNSALESTPELVNKDPYGEGWIFVLKLADPAELEELLDAAGYESLVGGQG